MRSLIGRTTTGEVVAGVAQLVEQRIRNAKVGGSIPLTGTMFFLVIQSITRLTPRKSRHDKIASPLGGVFFLFLHRN